MLSAPGLFNLLGTLGSRWATGAEAGDAFEEACDERPLEDEREAGGAFPDMAARMAFLRFSCAVRPGVESGVATGAFAVFTLRRNDVSLTTIEEEMKIQLTALDLGSSRRVD